MVMTANIELQRVREIPALRGFSNMFAKETRYWWHTRRGWFNGLLWTAILGGLVAMMLFMLPSVAAATGDPNVTEAGGPLAFGLQMGRTIFFELGTIALAIGVIVLSQDLIIDEKQSGVTEWLLAKPVARRSYILAKIGATLIAVLVFLITLPSLLSYLLLSLRMGSPFPFLPFLGGVAIMAAHTLFYLTMTIMLGTIFNSRPPILGVALGVLLGGNFLVGIFQPLVYATPWMLAKVASMVASQQVIPGNLVWSPIFATILWSIVFVTGAIASFDKTEF
jgi:ABC-2 type transport system permease protein